MTTVVIADDHELVRDGFRLMIEREQDLTVVGAASDGAMAIEETLAQKPDVLLLDLSLPKIHGLHVLTQLSTLKKTRVIILTGQTDRASVLEALRHGARGYIIKDSPRVELIAAIRAVAKGELFVSPQFEKFLREHAVNATRGLEVRHEELTIRERMVLQMIAAGNSNKTIATTLGISSRTVEKHRANFMTKLGLESHREIVPYAMREGLLSSPAPHH